MNARSQKRNKEYRKHLGIDSFLYFLPAHTYLLHDVKSVFIIIALYYLFVVHYNYSCTHEENAQKDSQEKQSSVKSVDISGIGSASYRKVQSHVF